VGADGDEGEGGGGRRTRPRDLANAIAGRSLAGLDVCRRSDIAQGLRSAGFSRGIKNYIIQPIISRRFFGALRISRG
jgi:hypothetical protein